METITFEQMPTILSNVWQELVGIKAMLNKPAETDVEKPIRIDEAAAFIQKEVPTLRALIHKNAIPHHRQGRRIYFFRTELVSWIKGAEISASIEAENRFLVANSKKSKGQ